MLQIGKMFILWVNDDIKIKNAISTDYSIISFVNFDCILCQH